MTTRISKTITPLTVHLKREIFSFPSIDSDEVFEDDFDSLEKLFRADVPTPDFNKQDSAWKSIVSYLWAGVGYLWESNTNVDSSQYDIEEFL